MSITRHILNEFRPIFRMLDEPLARSSAGFGRSRSLFDDPFFSLNREMLRGPALDISEAGNNYVVEAELPGVKKENLEVRIGDGGRSLTIEGKILAAKEGGENNTSEAATGEISTQLATQISTERSAIGNFTRTVVLPRPVDSSNVAAKLEDGVLKVTLSKVEDKGSVTVRVD
ncbi:HSP20-like chaperone [Mycena olivaceomarginata]|nr:HSP20-like chaperone [Mycena olivaceomarginata]